MLGIALLSALLSVAALPATAAAVVDAPVSYDIHIDNNDFSLDCLGQCFYDAVRTSLVPAWVLMGGGEASRPGLKYMVDATKQGDFVILRTWAGHMPVDRLNAIVQSLGPLNSVTTIGVKTRAGATHPTVLTRISNAEALFIPAGDVWDYFSKWDSSPVQIGINNVTTRTGGVVGGNAEGLALFGEFLFTAQRGPVPSPAAMRDPLAAAVTLGWKFVSVPPLAKAVVAPFFVTRDRMGQLLTVMARVIMKEWVEATDARGLGMDEGTCIVIREEDHTATVLSPGAIFFVTTRNMPEVVEAGTPLTFTGVAVSRLDATAGLSWDWRAWAPPAAKAYQLDVVNGDIVQDKRYGPSGPEPGPPG